MSNIQEVISYACPSVKESMLSHGNKRQRKKITKKVNKMFHEMYIGDVRSPEEQVMIREMLYFASTGER